MKRLLALATCLLVPFVASGKTRRLDGLPRTSATLAVTTVYGLTSTGRLITFNAATPQDVLTTVTITGLNVGDAPLGIDFRPSTEDLYLLTTSRLYVLDKDTGVATPLASTFTTGLVGSSFGVDFNPTSDQLRVVSDNQQNLRLDPATGAEVGIDTNLSFAAGDAHFGTAPHVVGAAYSNNAPTASATTLYDIDSSLDVLAIQNPPGAGTLTTVGGLGVDATDRVGFDIQSRSGTAYAAIAPEGASFSSLYTIDLGTGLAALVGNIGTLGFVNDIAVPIGIKRGSDTVGVYDSVGSNYFLRNSNTPGAADLTFAFGVGGLGYVPLDGDWNGDGIDTPGLYDQATGTFFLRNSNTSGPADLQFAFGAGGAGYVPLTGDWNGDGTDTIGVYNPTTGAFFLKNANAGGPANLVFVFGGGGLGYVPLSGDWNADGVDTVGLYRPSTGTFFLKNSNAAGPADVVFAYGPLNSVPVSGDFDNSGGDTIGVYVPGSAVFFLKNSNAAGTADLTVVYGSANQTPLVGDWDGL